MIPTSRRVSAPATHERFLLQFKRTGDTVLMKDGSTPFEYTNRDLASAGCALLESVHKVAIRVVSAGSR